MYMYLFNTSLVVNRGLEVIFCFRPRSTITCGYRQLRGGEGALSQGEWYVFDERLVLPEYLVTLDYTPVEEISGEECDFPSFDGSCETEPSPTCHPK